MRTMSHYLIIMLSIMLFVFRLIVTITTILGVEFVVSSIDVNLELTLLFLMLVAIILMTKNRLSGAIIFVVGSFVYYGPSLLKQIIYLSSNRISVEIAIKIVINLICVIIPIFAFFIVAFAKEQEKRPVNKKTDFFYKNEAYDIKHDKRDDTNNYRTS